MIEVQKLYNEIGFRVSGDLLAQIHQWEYSINKMIFEEQLETGAFRGKGRISPLVRFLMEKAKQAGRIMPYYGAGGSSGASVYRFTINGTQCCFQVEHSVAKEVLEVITEIQKPEALLNLQSQPEIQFSFLPYVTDEPLQHPWSGERNQVLICNITDEEYNNLVTWPHWANDEALTNRYTYKFGQVSIGPTGFSVTVTDRITNEVIDVTDYDSW